MWDTQRAKQTNNLWLVQIITFRLSVFTVIHRYIIAVFSMGDKRVRACRWHFEHMYVTLYGAFRQSLQNQQWLSCIAALCDYPWNMRSRGWIQYGQIETVLEQCQGCCCVDSIKKWMSQVGILNDHHCQNITSSILCCIRMPLNGASQLGRITSKVALSRNGVSFASRVGLCVSVILSEYYHHVTNNLRCLYQY